MAESPFVALARQAIAAYVKEEKTIEPPKKLTAEMKERAGVFVSLKKQGRLRGCIGTFAPTQPNVAQEIIANAVSAATRDPRFPPVEENEIKDLSISVDILTAPEPVKDRSDLDVKKYGVIVSSGPFRGLLLPDIEGVDTVEEQLSIAKRKAGILESESFEISRFEVKRYH